MEVEGLVVDWIFRQYEPDADWPHVEAVEDYRRRFGEPLPVCGACGFQSHDRSRCPGIVYDWSQAVEVQRALAALLEVIAL